MLGHTEIEKRLEDVDPQLCVAFATRCSLRVLPLLVDHPEKPFFWYWDEKNKPKFILSLFFAQQVSMNFAAFGNRSCIYAATRARVVADVNITVVDSAVDAGVAISVVLAILDAARAADADADVDAATVRAAVYAYAAAARARSDAAGAKTRVAVYAAAAATDVTARAFYSGLLSEIHLDLDLITSKKPISINSLIYSPIWSNSMPEQWQLLYDHFTTSLISLNSGFKVWIDWYNDRINGIPLDFKQEQQWVDIPDEIKNQGVKATNDYLVTLSHYQQKHFLRPLNLVRAIFIGNGATGKTSLIRKLKGESVVEGKEDMTPGIEIREWPLPESGIKARFWDFGGQVMSHSTHQFFLRERCLYILVVDAGSERDIRENQTANDQAEYWLEHIKAFGNNAPVMLVGNKVDKVAVNLDMNALTEKYKNIVGFYPLSCTSEVQEFKYDFDKFQAVLVNQLKNVGTHQVMFTQNQFEVLEQVRELSRKNAFLAHEKFDALCVEHDIGKEGLDKKAYLGLLDALGEIIHFPDLQWADAYVLNPRWLTYGVYTLLYSKEVEVQQGILSRADVVNILQAKKVEDEQGNELKYPKSKCGFIIDAMTQFKLCYELQQGGYYVIPDKLPKKQPNLTAYFDKKAEGVLAFEFTFTGLLPRNIMPNLIVARHIEIVRDKANEQLVWQRGVILHNQAYQATARWTVDYAQRCLQLWITGKEPREYLVILRDKVNEILNSIKGLSVKEYVLLPDSARLNDERFSFIDNSVSEKITYKSLLEQAKAGQKKVFSDAGNQYDLKKVMGFIMTDEKQKKEGVTSVSYDLRGANVGAVGGVGDKHKVSGKIVIKSSDKKDITDLQNALSDLMQHVQKHDADFEIKANAYGELKQIREHLDDLENASPETKGKLRDLLISVKDGSLGAIKLGTEIKEANELMTWIGEKAVLVSAFLATVLM